MKNSIKYLFVLISFLTGFTSIYAQTLNLNKFGIEEGLPQSSIYTMLHDNNGNIWVGTMSGVSKYNGLMFENYNKKNGLAETRTISSCIDKEGNIWFGHWAGGITVYNSKAKTFKEVMPGKYNIYKSITCLYTDASGIIWMGTDGLGLLRYEASSDSVGAGTFTLITKKEGFTSNNINSIIQNKDGMLWVATENGICKFKSGGKNYQSVNGIASNSIKTLLCDSKNNTWAGSSDKGLFKIETNGSIKLYDTKNGLSSNYVKVIFEDANGTIFIGTHGGGVSKYLPALEDNKYKGPLFQTISTEQGLSSDRVLSMIQDREKNIWIGTSLDLNQYFDEQFEIFGATEGLLNSLIWSVIQDKTGNFWLGTEGGLVKFNLAPNSNQSTFINYSNPYGNKITNTTALYEDVNGNIWYTDFGNGLSFLNPSTKQIKHYNLKSNEIYSITGDKDGNIWIGTNGGGVSKLDIKTEKIETYTAKSNGLGSDKVYQIYRDSKNNLWFASLAGSLTMYDGNKFKVFTDKEKYNARFTVCITEDNNGNLWFGSFDNGIYKYDGNSFKNYTTKDGLSSDSPFLLVCDNKNNLWIGTSLGIDKLNLADQSFKHYGKNDGFLGVEINPNAFCKDKEGNLWFGSIIGVVKYNSKNEKNNTVEPITTIKDPRINFEKAEIPADHVFSYSDNHLTFDFIGTSLTNPKSVRYQYMLQGSDKDWSPVVKNNFITYPNISPGPYTFKVKSCNNDGVWNKDPVTFSFEIKPPFWKTKWFYLLVILTIGGSVFIFIKNRERKLREQNLILENKVEERTLEINKQKEELSKKNENITDSIDYAKRIQEAVFVSSEQIKKALPQSFILFKPKDIVSGDFYWVHEKDGKILFAAVDCTGHGVPGAFMSIIGYNLLNRIVKDFGMTNPGLVLSELDKLVTETLSRESAGGNVKEVKDGMDISLCCYDPKTKTVEFAGAYNPLYHVRKNVLTEYKADKLPIGKSEMHKEAYTFTNHSIKIESGDLLYTFSDGYADQIGGPNKKKFYYGPFKELLTSINGLPMEEQKTRLDKNIINWLGSKEQVDDIIVIGIKF